MPHDYFVKLGGETIPPFEAPRHQDGGDVHLLLEKGIINPSPAQRDRITEIEAELMPPAVFHFPADE
ncbi:hypothetical protein D3C87_2044180 [compost metagenome]